jgi:hypothetical protein
MQRAWRGTRYSVRPISRLTPSTPTKTTTNDTNTAFVAFGPVSSQEMILAIMREEYD